MDKEDTTATDAAPDASSPDAEPLGDAGARALKAEREARKVAEKALRDAETRIANLEGAEIRREVATEKGLTSAQAKWLSGGTRDELAASADELLAAFGKPDPVTDYRPPKEDLRPGASRPDDSGDELAAMAERIISR